MEYHETESVKEMMSNKELDEAIQNDYENIKKFLPCKTSTHLSYKTGSTKAYIWNEGEKKKTKINLPLNDGWYETDNKFGIPNGKPSNPSNPQARYLWRWQNRDFDGLLVRGFNVFGSDGRDVGADYDGYDIRCGVLVEVPDRKR